MIIKFDTIGTESLIAIVRVTANHACAETGGRKVKSTLLAVGICHNYFLFDLAIFPPSESVCAKREG